MTRAFSLAQLTLSFSSSFSRFSLWKLPLLWILLSGNVFLFLALLFFFLLFWGVRRPRISAGKRKVKKQRKERSRRKTFSELLLLLLLRSFVFGSSKVKTARRVKCAYVCVRACVQCVIYKIHISTYIYY